MFLLTVSNGCEGFECPLNVIILSLVILLIIFCVGVYPGSCFFCKKHQKKICCFSLAGCGSIWELFYYDENKKNKSVKAEDNEEEEEFIPKRTHRYEMRDRKKNSSMNEDLFF